MPELSEFTVCVWLRLDDTNVSLFSYATPSVPKAMAAVITSNDTLSVSINSADWM